MRKVGPYQEDFGLTDGWMSSCPLRTWLRLIFLTANEHDCPACAPSTGTRLLWIPLKVTFWNAPSESGPKSISSLTLMRPPVTVPLTTVPMPCEHNGNSLSMCSSPAMACVTG